MEIARLRVTHDVIELCGHRIVTSGDFYGKGYNDSDRRIPDMTNMTKQLGWKPRTSLGELVDSTIQYQHQTYSHAIKKEQFQNW